ncbi:MAG: monofunctional biosynthetic peptidoglycan transglycosylase [Acidobacteria bacterium]|nr:monofunctional biosynthetic peptidoglycan transglycosylase [Acidobacteriota bacterium]
MAVLRRIRLKRLFQGTAIAVAGFYALIVLSLLMLKFVNPPTTSVQAQRRLESWFTPGKYEKRYHFVPLARISLAFQHAVIAAEDGNFYRHHGFDWEQIEIAIEEDREGIRTRGASTMSQQLVKNLFYTTKGSFVRKGLEFTTVPLAELILGKQRILELYLNVVEWGPGVWGAEAAAQFHYRLPASAISRESGARLAAILPNPRKRRPARMNNYSAIILQRMAILGW